MPFLLYFITFIRLKTSKVCSVWQILNVLGHPGSSVCGYQDMNMILSSCLYLVFVLISRDPKAPGLLCQLIFINWIENVFRNMHQHVLNQITTVNLRPGSILAPQKCLHCRESGRTHRGPTSNFCSSLLTFQQPAHGQSGPGGSFRDVQTAAMLTSYTYDTPFES